MDEHRTRHKVKPRDIKKGDLMALTYWVKVTDVGHDGITKDPAVIADDLDHGIKGIVVKGHSLLESTESADQFHTTEKVTQTRAAEILTSAHRLPFTVNFIKDNGEERTLRGRFLGSVTQMGRSNVEDLDQPASNRRRQVDHRTIQWIIIQGVKYVVK